MSVLANILELNEWLAFLGLCTVIIVAWNTLLWARKGFRKWLRYLQGPSRIGP